MKKQLSLLMAMAWLLMAGCQTAEQLASEGAQPPRVAAMSTLRATLIQSTWVNYLQVWSGMTNDQKYAVWQEKLDETIELPTWDHAQRAKIQEMRSTFSPSRSSASLGMCIRMDMTLRMAP
jgi:hypothetical protein